MAMIEYQTIPDKFSVQHNVRGGVSMLCQHQGVAPSARLNARCAANICLVALLINKLVTKMSL